MSPLIAFILGALFGAFVLPLVLRGRQSPAAA